jgi:hypothetical protein
MADPLNCPVRLAEEAGRDNTNTISVNNVGSQLEGLIMTVTREELSTQLSHPRDEDDDDSENSASEDDNDDGDHSSSESLSLLLSKSKTRRSSLEVESRFSALDSVDKNNSFDKTVEDNVVDSQQKQPPRIPNLDGDQHQQQQNLVKSHDLNRTNGKDNKDLGESPLFIFPVQRCFHRKFSEEQEIAILQKASFSVYHLKRFM